MMSLPLAQKAGDAVAALDGAVDAVQGAVRDAVGSSRTVANALDGTWLGAPLHVALTDVPIGALTAAVALDLAGRREADAALAVGVAGALPAAATGLADWRYLRGEERRIATAHALLNVTGLVFHAGSLAARRADRRGLGRGLLLVGYAINGLAAHIGGQLSFGLGVRVNRPALEPKPPAAWTDAGEDDLTPDELRRVEVEGAPVVVARSGRGLCAIAATCSHLGGPLDEGTREGDSVVCPWHGSRFDLCTGEVIDGPAVFPQPAYDAQVHEGRLEVRGRQG
jgi:nitrite reductase/ring-hydroxylating ferredoxin subunit